MIDALARFIRLRDAPDYLGMDRKRFNAEPRPRLTDIPIGVQGVAFDRQSRFVHGPIWGKMAAFVHSFQTVGRDINTIGGYESGY